MIGARHEGVTREQLDAVGKEWSKGDGSSRWYVNDWEAMIGLEVCRYNTGNVSDVEWHGQHRSNSWFYKNSIGSTKVWVGASGAVHVEYCKDEDVAKEIVEAVEARIEAVLAESAQEEEAEDGADAAPADGRDPAGPYAVAVISKQRVDVVRYATRDAAVREARKAWSTRWMWIGGIVRVLAVAVPRDPSVRIEDGRRLWDSDLAGVEEVVRTVAQEQDGEKPAMEFDVLEADPRDQVAVSMATSRARARCEEGRDTVVMAWREPLEDGEEYILQADILWMSEAHTRLVERRAAGRDAETLRLLGEALL